MGAFRLQHSVSISVGLHLLLLLALAIGARIRPEIIQRSRNLTWIEVEPLAPTVAAPQQNQKAKQLVRTDRGQESKTTDPDAFMGERTQTVDRQQVSQTRIGEQQRTSAPRQGKRTRAETTAAKPESSLAPTAQPGGLAKFGIALPVPGRRTDDAASSEQVGSLSAQAQGEYVKGFKEGERTLLNTREYVFYGYFQRIRQKLDLAWERSLKTRLDQYFRRGRQLASDTEYVTQLLVTLDENGQVTRVQTVGASGTRDLDDAAVKAFNEAGPFPNPPKGLIESSGKIQVRWDFVLRT